VLRRGKRGATPCGVPGGGQLRQTPLWKWWLSAAGRFDQSITNREVSAEVATAAPAPRRLACVLRADQSAFQGFVVRAFWSLLPRKGPLRHSKWRACAAAEAPARCRVRAAVCVYTQVPSATPAAHVFLPFSLVAFWILPLLWARALCKAPCLACGCCIQDRSKTCVRSSPDTFLIQSKNLSGF
jgi:hypothetical protein